MILRLIEGRVNVVSGYYNLMSMSTQRFVRRFLYLIKLTRYMTNLRRVH
jgi:hypothetical protein